MIILKIQGGLGNQLFQYATGRAISIANNAELVLDLSWFENQIEINTKRVYELGAFKIKGRVVRGDEIFWCRIHQNRILSKLRFLHREWTHIKEKDQLLNEKSLEKFDHVYLDGYWQSYRYFDQVFHAIREEFAPIIDPSPADAILIERINSLNSVSVHIRRGDYVTNPRAASFHGLCSLEYYQMAMSRLEKQIACPHYFIFSDDIEWAKKNIHIEPGVTFMESTEGRSSVDDLRLMSLCKHNIIANSSFSWWAAWLNFNPDKLVFAPKKWFVNESPEFLIPKDWIVL